MKKFLLLASIGLAGLGLEACANGQFTLLSPLVSGPTAERSIYTLKTAYATALEVVVIYRNEPVCGAGVKWTLAAPCHDAGTLAVIRSADAKAYSAVNVAQAAVDANPDGLAPVALLSAAQSAITALTASTPH